jgi:hypothetical protein
MKSSKASLAAARRFRMAHPERVRETTRRVYAARRDQINQIKLELGCVDCGFKGHPAALDFDHLPGTVKSHNVGNLTTASWAVLKAEIAKCEVVCSNCHRIRTAERGGGGNHKILRVSPPSLFDAEGVA